jgi:hypothetical protein
VVLGEVYRALEIKELIADGIIDAILLVNAYSKLVL